MSAYFRLGDPSKVLLSPKFSAQRFADGVNALPRSTASTQVSSPHQFHSPIRGMLSIHNILSSKAGLQVGLLCQRSRGRREGFDSSGGRNKSQHPACHYSLFLPPGLGHSFLAVLLVEKGRQNCMTCLLLFLLIFYQSAAHTVDHHGTSHRLTTRITRILAEVFDVAELGQLKKILLDMGLHI